VDAVDLTSPDYWQSEEIDIRVNPQRPVNAGGLREFLEVEVGIRSAVVLAGSGSTGVARWVVLEKRALLASAGAVNTLCGAGPSDRWLCALPTFHVGGLGIYARAFLGGAGVVSRDWRAWSRDAGGWLRALDESQATLTSLTPHHLFDIVSAGVRCPPLLRGLFLGGGRIDDAMVQRAAALGWPVWPTYGMSEAASQIATSTEGSADWLPVLPHWQCALAPDQRLRIRGPALFSGCVVAARQGWEFLPAAGRGGWFTTGDICEMRHGCLRFLRRADQTVKISGELVSLDHLNARAKRLGIPGEVLAMPDPRKENTLVLAVWGETLNPAWLDLFNEGLPSLERPERIVPLYAAGGPKI
jgi:o-succinylbenzoate---CoA ligase